MIFTKMAAPYPCEPSSARELHNILNGVAMGSSGDCEEFKRISFYIPTDQIIWNSIHNLYILGLSNQDSNRALQRVGLKPGAYINHYGDHLLLIHPDESTIQACWDLCEGHLKCLYLFHTKFRKLDLSSLTNLHTLKIEDNTTLSSIKGLDQLSKLSILVLSGCSSLTMLPEEIRTMTNLRALRLRNMHFLDLPDWLPEIAGCFISGPDIGYSSNCSKAFVYLLDIVVDNIPDMSIFDQPYEIIADWFRKRRRGDIQTLNEIKVVFLGDGEAGKSHTIARLMNDGGDPVDYMDQATPGIVIKNKEYELGGRKFQVHYWDFGGQEIMHSMHRIFLTNRTMYVVLLNARDDTQSDRARYWLHNIKSFAPDAPVLLVLNKIDQNENASVDEVDLRNRYEKLTRIVRLSARNYSQEDFNTAFTDILKQEILNTGFLDAQWPTSWTQVKLELEHMTSHYIKGDAYKAICSQCQVDENQQNLLHWFNDLGISFCCCDESDYELEDYVILRPDWITNALYIMLFNHLEGAKNGLIPHKTIHNLLKSSYKNANIRCTLPEARYDSNDIQYVLGVMRKFSLSFTDRQGNEFVPMLCQQNSTLDVQIWRKDPGVLEFNMEFDYLPNNLLHRLMVDRRDELDKENVWRTGARFRHDELGYSALVVIDGDTLRFLIRGTNPMHRPNTYLTMLKANVDRIIERMNLKAPSNFLIYKLEGKQDKFNYADLKLLLEVGQTLALSTAHRRMLPIEDILNQSAPDGLEDEIQILAYIQESCSKLQAEQIYHLRKDPNSSGYLNGQRMEDLRNRRVRDDMITRLQDRGYRVYDQTQVGTSASGNGVGELDMLIRTDDNKPWTIIEALRVRDNGKTEWNRHLEKLIKNYNIHGLPRLYLLTYVDANPKDFGHIWESYQFHIRNHSIGSFSYVDGSYSELKSASSHHYTKTVKCHYNCGGDTTTVYHVFVRIPLYGE